MKNFFRSTSLALFAVALTASVYGSTFQHSALKADHAAVYEGGEPVEETF